MLLIRSDCRLVPANAAQTIAWPIASLHARRRILIAGVSICVIACTHACVIVHGVILGVIVCVWCVRARARAYVCATACVHVRALCVAARARVCVHTLTYSYTCTCMHGHARAWRRCAGCICFLLDPTVPRHPCRRWEYGRDEHPRQEPRVVRADPRGIRQAGKRRATRSPSLTATSLGNHAGQESRTRTHAPVLLVSARTRAAHAPAVTSTALRREPRSATSSKRSTRRRRAYRKSTGAPHRGASLTRSSEAPPHPARSLRASAAETSGGRERAARRALARWKSRRPWDCGTSLPSPLPAQWPVSTPRCGAIRAAAPAAAGAIASGDELGCADESEVCACSGLDSCMIRSTA